MKEDEVYIDHNVLVHNYLGIDLQIVWSITQREVPELKRALLDIQSGE